MKVKRAFTWTFFDEWKAMSVRCVGGNKNGIIIVIIIKVFECFLQAHDDGVNQSHRMWTATNERFEIRCQTTWQNGLDTISNCRTRWTTCVSGVNTNALCFHSHLVATLHLDKAHEYAQHSWCCLLLGKVRCACHLNSSFDFVCSCLWVSPTFFVRVHQFVQIFVHVFVVVASIVWIMIFSYSYCSSKCLYKW